MPTTTAPITVMYPPRIVGNDNAEAEVVRGLCAAEGAAPFEPVDAILDEYVEDGDADPRVVAWGKLVEEVARELAPDVAQLLEDALMARLPWTAPAADR